MDALAATSALDVVATGIDNHEDCEYLDDNKLSDATDDDHALALSSQLVALSQRATRAMRRLVHRGEAPLTVSSPEVNGALEDTNTLIRIINDIATLDNERGEAVNTSAATTTNSAVPFLAITCHQHLVALFRAICDAIYRCQKEKDEHYELQDQQPNRGGQYSAIGPSSVAQFVMVLQLLMHLINRIDRSLFQSHSSILHGAKSSTGDQIIPATSRASIPSQAAAGGSSPNGGLLILVEDLVRAIPNEHEKLRQAIQKLQTEIELRLGNG